MAGCRRLVVEQAERGVMMMRWKILAAIGIVLTAVGVGIAFGVRGAHSPLVAGLIIPGIILWGFAYLFHYRD